jgi:PhnB protein
MTVVRGSGRRQPTLAADVVRARSRLSTADEVGLALRAHRRALGANQREYARLRGWTKTHQHRLERSPGGLKFSDVLEALTTTGFGFLLCREDGHRDEGPDASAPVDVSSWPAGELVARDAAGRRYPAGRVARRTGPSEPRWWWMAHSTEARAEPPLWTASRSPREGPPKDPSPPHPPPGSLSTMDQPTSATDPGSTTGAQGTTLTPKLVTRDADAAIAFYKSVFGASLVERHAFRGRVVYALLEMFGSRISLKDEDEHDPAPTTTGRPGVLFEITTADPDGVAVSVVRAGGEVVFEIADQPYGASGGRVRDPFGHEWLVQTPVTMSPDETEATLDAAADGQP